MMKIPINENVAKLAKEYNELNKATSSMKSSITEWLDGVIEPYEKRIKELNETILQLIPLFGLNPNQDVITWIPYSYNGKEIPAGFTDNEIVLVRYLDNSGKASTSSGSIFWLYCDYPIADGTITHIAKMPKGGNCV